MAATAFGPDSSVFLLLVEAVKVRKTVNVWRETTAHSTVTMFKPSMGKTMTVEGHNDMTFSREDHHC